MKVCVFGAGAVGSFLAAKLVRADVASVSVVARGAHLEAIQVTGITVHSAEGDFQAKVANATDRPSTLPPQDLVFVTLKAKDLPAAASDIASLVHDDGRVVFVGNGIPWWWKLGAEGGEGHLTLLDPDGGLATKLGSRTIGCVVYSMNSLLAPGHVRHAGNNRWILGTPFRAPIENLSLKVAAALLERARLMVECPDDLRREVWIKLLKNAPLNPICALTRLATDELSGRPELIALVQTLADEDVSLAKVMGWDVSAYSDAAVNAISTGGALPGAKARGTRPSMLQDALAGRQMEVASILGQLAQFAAEYGVSTPTLRTVFALLAGLDTSLASRMTEEC